MNNFQALQGQQLEKNKNNDDKMNKLINEFLEMKEIDKSYLYRLVDKIEIDKDKNVFITFNFAPLNTISENFTNCYERSELQLVNAVAIDDFTPIEQILDNKENVV